MLAGLNTMKKAFSLSFSTIAVVVAVLAVLLMVVIFFSRGFGTTEKSMANIMDRPVAEMGAESRTGGTLDISSWLPSLAKKWCSGTCTKDADCCPSDKPAAECVCKCGWACTGSTRLTALKPTGSIETFQKTTCYYDDTSSAAIGGKNAFGSEAACKTACADACGATTGSSDDCSRRCVSA